MNPNYQNDQNGASNDQPQNEQLFAPRYSGASQPQPPNPNAFPWQQNQQNQQSQPSQQPTPSQPTPPPIQPQYQQQWNQSVAPQQPQRQQAQPQPSATPQYGGQMNELPPLAAGNGQQQIMGKPRRNINKLVIGLLSGVAVILLIVGGLVAFSLFNKEKQKEDAKVLPISYVDNDITGLVKEGKIDQSGVTKLDKTAAFYTIFKQAAKQSIVQTKWDVYYTTNDQDKRSQQYTIYNVGINYDSKQYSYTEDSYSTIGTIQSRCVDGQLYVYNNNSLSVGTGWQPASDSSSCKFNIVSTRMNDGINAGGLTDGEANTFVQAINQAQVIKVNSVSVEEKNGGQYLKFDVNLTPRKAAEGIYWGMQNLMTAFQSTNIDAEKHPYTYFGAGADGMHLVYYADPTTLLPVYSVATSTPTFNQNGQAVTPDSYSHRFVEYTFPERVVPPTLDDFTLAQFSAWPDH